jgi:cytochrome c oxidase subunit 2
VRQTTTAAVTPTRSPGGLRWLYWGIGLSSVGLVGALIWTVIVLAEINGPPSTPALTIEITGQQWWWKARYLSDDASRTLTTANEIHIPTGRPVRIKLIGADVIHSFWVPKLAGKMDTIPGQTNQTWIEADRPGRYRGQCTEYCGAQHAHMAIIVVAEPPAEFAAWLDAQLAPAGQPTDPHAAAGAQTFQFRCGACHTVRGTKAAGTTGPDLTHLMSRSTIAAGTLTNTVANLSAWIANPQAIKPGTTMPVLYLSGPELAGVRAYLRTLK